MAIMAAMVRVVAMATTPGLMCSSNMVPAVSVGSVVSVVSVASVVSVVSVVTAMVPVVTAAVMMVRVLLAKLIQLEHANNRTAASVKRNDPDSHSICRQSPRMTGLEASRRGMR